jgi:GNAT superfamily N-acetyltransferase
MNRSRGHDSASSETSENPSGWGGKLKKWREVQGIEIRVPDIGFNDRLLTESEQFISIAILKHWQSRRAWTEQQVGGCDAKLLKRDGFGENFWRRMGDLSEVKADLAFDLFDRYGRLNPEFYDNGVNRGTGVWGRDLELDEGYILLFDRIHVDSDHRRKGIGRELVSAILKKAKDRVMVNYDFFAIARPGILQSDIPPLKEDSPESRQAQRDAAKVALAFWHSMGFRRVGTSEWLAWKDSANHPSRQLAIEDDWERPYEDIALVPLSDEVVQALRMLENPVEDARCITVLANTFPGDYQDGQWQMVDRLGNTLLHLAVLNSKPYVARFILSNVHRLADIRNKGGHTPLEALKNRLERLRTRHKIGWVILDTSDMFEGFTASDIECLAVLENKDFYDISHLGPQQVAAIVAATAGQPPAPEISHLPTAVIRQMLHLKYGCTCGHCIGGFLSPRMKYSLLYVAAKIYHNNEKDIDNGPEWMLYNDHRRHFDYLHRSVRENLKTNKLMREGLTNMFSHFAWCLWQDRIPTQSEVLNVYPDEYLSQEATETYLSRGGTVEAVANIIFRKTLYRDTLAGNPLNPEVPETEASSSEDEVPKDEAPIDQASEDEIYGLVPCRNDREFGCVAVACGYKIIQPYWKG